MSAQKVEDRQQQKNRDISNPYLEHLQPASEWNDSIPREQFQRSGLQNKMSDPISYRRHGPPSKRSGPPPRQQHPRKYIKTGLYGNYTAYYSSRRLKGHTQDPRMSLIPSILITDKNVLDIGCNSGNFSIMLALKHKPAHMLGVDIDERLIHTAHMNLKQVYSLRDPDSDTIDADIGLRYHYFPTSMSTMFGFIGTLPKTKHLTEFPNNVQFKAVDWLKTETEMEKFDTILALSVTKWVHLHNGDQGIKDFFKKIYNALKLGGVFVLEAQSFDSYKLRTKGEEHMKEVYAAIQLKPDQFPDFLTTEVGFQSYEIAGSAKSSNKGFERPIYLFKK